MSEPIRKVSSVSGGVARAEAVARLARVERQPPREEEDANARKRQAPPRRPRRPPPPDDGLPHIDVCA